MKCINIYNFYLRENKSTQESARQNAPHALIFFIYIFDTWYLKETINFLTDKVCGSNKNIIDKPIVLSVYSHTCPDLTLVDLPGITRIPIEGQPDNIEQITRAMANRYVSDSRTIILCVLPANADMTTSDGL